MEGSSGDRGFGFEGVGGSTDLSLDLDRSLRAGEGLRGGSVGGGTTSGFFSLPADRDRERSLTGAALPGMSSSGGCGGAGG